VTLDVSDGFLIEIDTTVFYKENSVGRSAPNLTEMSVWISNDETCSSDTVFFEYPNSSTTGSFCTHSIGDSSNSSKVTACKGNTTQENCKLPAADNCVWIINNCF